MTTNSGVERARRFHEKADAAQREADKYRRMALACEKGAAGEEEVARLLDVLDGSGWHVLNDRYKAAGSPVNIDHIVVGPPGVLVVDAKNWAGGPVRLDEQGMSHGGHRRDAELEGVLDAAAVVGGHARGACGTAVTVGALAFVGAAGPPAPVFHHRIMVVRADQLLPWLTGLPAQLTPQQVNLVASTLDAALPPRSGSSRPFTVSGLAASLPRQTLERRTRSTPGAASPSGSASTGPARRRRAPHRNALSESLGHLLLRLAVIAFVLLILLPAMLNGISDSLTRSEIVSPRSPQPPGSSTPAVSPAPG